MKFRHVLNGAAAALFLLVGAVYAAEINDLSPTDASNTARFPENMAPSDINDGARALEGLIARWHKDANCSVATTGSANAYALSANQTLSAYYDGLFLCFDANFANTGAATLNVDSLGAKTIKKFNDQDLESGDIEANQKVLVVYDGTSFQLLSVGGDPLADGSVTSAKLALNAVTGAHIAMGSDAQGDVLYYDGTDYARLGAGTSGQFLQTQGAGANPQWSGAGLLARSPTGVITGVVKSGTGTIPFDDSLPQCGSEGTEFMTFTYPGAQEADNTLVITVNTMVSSNTTGQMTVILCESTSADAIAGTSWNSPSGGSSMTISFMTALTAPTTGSTTFSVRAGTQNAGTTTFNGSVGARRLGGAMASSLFFYEFD